ncbi:Protein of unknown function [Streptococcus thermophilus]|nr:Protein of unknown function [Streptococcus thermophilus]
MKQQLQLQAQQHQQL